VNTETIEKLKALGIPARDYDLMDLHFVQGAFMRWNNHNDVSVEQIYNMTPEQADYLRLYIYAAVLPKKN
jgi:hypothetical protein